MVVVRAQDFASRTLRRVSGELNGMSKAEAIAQRQSMFNLKKMQQSDRIRSSMGQGRGLELLKHRIQLEEQLARVQAGRGPLQAGGGQGFVSRTAAIKQLENALGSAQKRFDMLDPSLQRFDSRIRGMANPIGQLDRALEGNKRKLTQLGVSAGMTRREIAAFEKAIRALPLQNLDNIGHAMGGIGRTMQLFGAIGTASLGIAANSFAKFNTEVTLAATQTRQAGQTFAATAVNANRLGKEILGMMRQFPASSQEMAQAAYDIFSSIDVGFGSGIKLLREFNRVAVAGGVDLQTATHASITVLENFDRTLATTGRITEKTHEILNRMFSIVRFGRLNFQQLDHVLTSVVPAAKGAGLSFNEISGAIALVSRTLDATKTGPALARLIEVFTNPDVQAGMRKAGLAIADLSGHLIPFPNIIEKVAALSRGHNLNDAFRIISAFGRGSGRGREFTVQARRAFIQLAKSIQEYRKVQGATVADNDEFRNSFAAMSQTLGVRWQVFLNQLKVLVLYMGEQAIPIFLRIGDVVSSWLDKWRSLSEGTRRTIVQWAAILSISALIAGVFLSIAGALLTMYAALRMALPKITATESGMFKLAGTLRILSGIGAIVIGIELLKKGDGWSLLGGGALGAGLGMLLKGGARGSIIGATIGIAATLAFKGDGWQSKIGQILLGAGAGFAFGGPGGAALGAAAAVIPILIEVHHNAQDTQKAYSEMLSLQADAVKKTAAAQNISTKQAANQVFNGMLAANARANNSTKWTDINTKAGFLAAIAFLKEYTKTIVQPGGPRDAFDGLARDAQAAFDNVQPDKGGKGKQSLREQLRTAKSFTELMNTVNQQTSAETDKMQELAVAIAQAFSRGNAGKVANLINAFTSKTNKVLTAQNIGKLVTDAVASGDIKQATTYLEDWAQKVEDGRRAMDDYRRQMKDYGKQIADTSKQAMVDVIDNLKSMYQQMQDANTQAFGQLFQGPWLTSQTFDIAKEWGITPRLQDMIKDLKQQNNVFARWRSSLDKIFKKGLPTEFVDEIRKMGPEQGQAFVDNILKAKPGQVNALITQWKRRNTQIQSATKMDFKDEIDRFRKAGVSMGEAIINGFESAQTSKWFDNWVKVTFPGVINNAVNNAVRDFKTGTPPPTMPTVPGRVPGQAAAAARTAGATGVSSTTNDHSKKWEVHINMPKASHDEGSAQAYAAKKEAMRRAAFIARNVLRGLQ